VKILVVGCGSIGARHVRNFSALAETSVTDANLDLARKVAEETGAALQAGLEQGLAWRPDGVVVAVPNDLHLPVALRAVEAGAHVYVEKPLSDSTAGAREFLDRAEALGREVFVGCNMRFHPAVAGLKEHLPRIGRPLFARAHYGNLLPNMRPGQDYRTLYCARRASGGGVILDAIHEIGYLSWLLGPARLESCTADRLSDLEIEVEDFASLVLRHGSGALSQVQMDYLRPCKRRGCEIVGTEGVLCWTSEGKAPERVRLEFCRVGATAAESLLELDGFAMNGPFIELARSFLAALAGASTSLLTGREALLELELAIGALRLSGMVPQEET